MARSHARTFIAVPLEDKIRARLVSLQEELGEAGTEVKWVEPENLHVTLLFLGEVPLRESIDVCRAVRGAVEKIAPFAMEPAGVGCFPNARRPRTLWVGAAEGHDDLIELHQAIESPLLDLGCYRREERGYTPHITLGRIKTDAVTEELRAAIQKQADRVIGRQLVREVHVLSSELRSAGPSYTVLSREKLRAASEPVE